MKKLQRILELYDIGGVTEVVRGLRDHAKSAVSSNSSYTDKRVDNEDRWNLIQPHLNDTGSLIDIGCAEGYFISRAAKQDYFSVGIDIDDEMIKRAYEKLDHQSGVGLMRLGITPENITKLPSVDIILFMTVHHHWTREFGLDEAERMFQVLLDRANTVAYEPPGDRPLVDSEKSRLHVDESIRYYKEKLNVIYGDDIEIKDSGTFGRFGSTDRDIIDRKDPLFIIDSSDYEI